MTTPKLREILDQNHIKYQIINHLPAYTAQQTAEASHIAGREMAKTVMIKVDGKLKMFVFPATKKIDFNEIKQEFHAKSVTLATEQEFQNQFPGCEVGAMPPFGNLFGIETVVSAQLAHCDKIAFNAGNHTEVIKLSYKDFDNLVHPIVLKAA